jgi:CubicO group peptidase (beta-lactamase class C family)
MAVVLTVLAPGSATAHAPNVDAARLDRFVESALTATGTPGAAMAVIRDGQAGEARGFGSAGGGGSVGLDTRFLVGSVSKSFTAVAVVQLRDAGLVDLDAPVQT